MNSNLDAIFMVILSTSCPYISFYVAVAAVVVVVVVVVVVLDVVVLFFFL